MSTSGRRIQAGAGAVVLLVLALGGCSDSRSPLAPVAPSFDVLTFSVSGYVKNQANAPVTQNRTA